MLYVRCQTCTTHFVLVPLALLGRPDYSESLVGPVVIAESAYTDATLDIHVNPHPKLDEAQPVAEGLESVLMTSVHRAAYRNAVIDSILSGNSSVLKPAPADETAMPPQWRSTKASSTPSSAPQASRLHQPLTSTGGFLSLEDSLASVSSYGRGGWSHGHTKELYRSIVWDQAGMAAVIAGRSARGSVHHGAGSSVGTSQDIRQNLTSSRGPSSLGASQHVLNESSAGKQRRSRSYSRVRSRSSKASGAEPERRTAQMLWGKARLAEMVSRQAWGPKRFAGAEMEGPIHGIHRAMIPKFVPASVSVAAAHSRRELRLPERIPNFRGAAALALPHTVTDAHDILLSSKKEKVKVERLPSLPGHARADARLQSVQREVFSYKKLVEQADFGRNALDVVVLGPTQELAVHGGDERGDGPGRGSQSGSHSSDVPELAGKSFKLFPVDMWLRRRVYVMVSHQRFENFMLFCIFLSCGAMVYEHPQLKPDALDTRLLWWLDIVLTSFFGAECLLKMFAYCAMQYLKENSNKVCCCSFMLMWLYCFLRCASLDNGQ